MRFPGKMVLDGLLPLLCVDHNQYNLDVFTWSIFSLAYETTNLEGFSAFCLAASFFCMKLVNTGTILLQSEAPMQCFCLEFVCFLFKHHHPSTHTPNSQNKV